MPKTSVSGCLEVYHLFYHQAKCLVVGHTGVIKMTTASAVQVISYSHKKYNMKTVLEMEH